MLLLTWFIFSGSPTFAQKPQITGIVRDEITRLPIRDVNIRINGTNKGTVTDKEGRFSLTFETVPAGITITCIGYETVYYDIAKVTQAPMELIMRPRVYTLGEVDISSKRYRFVFRDMDYSVLDYEIMDDNLLLLVFRYQLRRSELILLTLSGDTVSIVPIPEGKPSKLYKDFLGNVHYVSNHGNTYQCYYNDSLKHFGFPFKSTYDTLLRKVQPFLFTSNDRLYFQEFAPDGFSTRIGYYNKGHEKKYIRLVSDETTRKNYYADVKFDNNWNEKLQANTLMTDDRTGLGNPALMNEYDMQAHRHFFARRINAPLLKLGESNLAVFNFSDDRIELLGADGEVYETVPIDFHKEDTENPFANLLGSLIGVDWKWKGEIQVDEYYRTAYTIFRKNGMEQIRKIDLETGKLTNTFDLPYPFPEKIRIYKGVAYFLVLGPGQYEKWKLVMFRLL